MAYIKVETEENKFKNQAVIEPEGDPTTLAENSPDR